MEPFQFTEAEKLQLFNAIQQAVNKRNIDEAARQLQAAQEAAERQREQQAKARADARNWFNGLDDEQQIEVLLTVHRKILTTSNNVVY